MWGAIGKKLLGWGSQTAAAISPFGLYIKIGLIALVVGVIGNHMWNDHKQSKALSAITQELGTIQQQHQQAQHTLVQNALALTECLDANAWNASQARNQELQKVKALAQIRLLETINERNAEDIYREEAELRNRDQECRTADDPLPGWLLPDSLWND